MPEESDLNKRLILDETQHSILRVGIHEKASILSSWLLPSSRSAVLRGSQIVDTCHLQRCGFGWQLEGIHKITYYSFGNDDKYFVHLKDGTVYSDSTAYRAFYERLPTVSINHDYSFSRKDPDVYLLLSRQQYGHFLYDDLLPLVSHLIRQKSTNVVVRLLYSKCWQRRLVHEIFDLCGLSVDIDEHRLLRCTHNFFLCGKMILSRYPYLSHDWNSLFPWKRPCKTSYPNYNVYISREMFDETRQRLVNREALKSLLSKFRFRSVYPELLTVNEIVDVLSRASIVVADPGTTPLIAGLFTPSSTPIIVLQSARTAIHCSMDYAYSGWRYHLPWLNQFQYLYCKSHSPLPENPFSDRIDVPTDLLRDRLTLLS